MRGITSFAGSPQFTLQQVIDKRYHVLETLGQRQWERTYLALDTHADQQPCIVKEFCLDHNSSQTLQAVKARFEYENNWLTALGGYNRVARLLNMIVTEHAVYLVREFVAGEPVAADETVGDRWNEQQVLTLLVDVLTVLQFAHSKAGIHGNLHPRNIIRREADGRFVLTDVCAISPIGLLLAETQIAAMPGKLDRLGYFAKEQLWQRPRPSSDLFSLGLIGVELLTGLRPWDIPRHSKTRQLLWRSIGAKEQRLTDALTYMTQENYRDRAQSAHEVLAILNESVPVQQFVQRVRQKRQEKAAQRSQAEEQAADSSPSPGPSDEPQDEPAQSGGTLGNLNSIAIATSALVAVGGSFAFVHPAVLLLADTAPKRLERAEQRYQQGDVDGAIALLASISPRSASFPMAQATAQYWQQDWDHSTKMFSELEAAYLSQQWLTVLRKSQAISPTDFWTAQIAPFVAQAQANIDRQGHESLQDAFDLAYEQQFADALDALRRIPPESAAYAQVPAKFAEYAEKRDIREQYYLQQAYDEAQAENFMHAIAYLQRITPASSSYAIAQRKRLEYAEKLRLRTRSITQATRSYALSPAETWSETAGLPPLNP